MNGKKSRSPSELSEGRPPLIMACLPLSGRHTDSQGCASIYFTLYCPCECWYHENRQNKQLSIIKRKEV